MEDHRGIPRISDPGNEGRDRTGWQESEADGVGVFNRAELLARIGDNKALAKKLVDMFLAQVEKALPVLEKALTERDGAAICRTLHSLKGSAGAIGADRIYRLAGELYTIGKQGDLASLADSLGSLCKEYGAFSSVAAMLDAEEQENH